MSQPSHDSEVVPQMQLPPRLLDLWETEMAPQLPATLDEQARARKRLSTLPKDRAGQRSVTSAACLGAGRMLVSPVGMLGGNPGSGRYLRSGLAQTRPALRGVVALAADRSGQPTPARSSAYPATGDPGGWHEPGTNGGHGR
jgi:hypothetical protein